MKLNFSVNLTAADESARTISGRIVTFGEKGNTSIGATIFAPDSLKFNKNTKLLLEHDRTRPIGKLLTYTKHEEGIDATFKVAGTIAGDDSLLEASEGLRDGFSVGAFIEDYKVVNGVMNITAARIQEVSLVTEPAIDSARVSEVAASEEPENSEATAEDQPKEENQVSEATSEAPIATDAVEAAHSEPVVTAKTPVAYTKPIINVTKRDYLANTLKANLFQDEEARNWVKAADNDQSSAAGFIPTPQSTELLNFLSNADRPVIDSISRGAMPAFGKTFELPKITAVPVVSQVNENSPVTESTLEADYLTVTKKSFKGRAITTLELISNSTPAFLDELVRQMEVAYAKETETYATNAIQTASPYVPVPGFDNDSDDLLKFVSTSASLIYKDSLGFARNIVVTPEQWANIMAYNDNGRPIYIASNPQNNAGVLSPAAVSGTVAGLQLRVSRYIDGGVDNVGNGSMAVINPDAYTWYEDARQQLRTNINSDGTVDILLFGQGALATKLADGVRWFRKA